MDEKRLTTLFDVRWGDGWDGSICAAPDVPFWSPWNSVSSDFHQCFENVTVPSVFVVLIFFYTPVCFSRSVRSVSVRNIRTRLELLYSSLLLLCFLLPTVLHVVSIASSSFVVSTERSLALILTGFFFLHVAFIDGILRRKGINQHPLLKFIVSLHLIFKCILIQSLIRLWISDRGGLWRTIEPWDVFQALCWCLEIVLVASYCLCRPTQHNVQVGDGALLPVAERRATSTTLLTPEQNAGLLSLLTFGWMHSILKRGKSGLLGLSDLYGLAEYDTAAKRSQKAMEEWQNQIQSETHCTQEAADPARHIFSTRASTARDTNLDNFFCSTGTTDEAVAVAKPEAAAHIDVFWLLVKILWRRCALAAFLKLVFDLQQFVGPIILNRTIKFIVALSQADPPPIANGLTLGAVLLVSNVVQSFILHQYFHIQMRLGMWIRTSLSCLIYRKALDRFPGLDAQPAPQESANTSCNQQTHKNPTKTLGKMLSTTGQAVTILSVDTQRLQDLMTYFHAIWSGPLQITIAIILLFRVLGVASLAGFAVILISGSLTGSVGRRLSRIQKNVMAIRDERTNIIGEVLNGIKIIKLYAWEDSFHESIGEIRRRELSSLWKYQLTALWTRVQWNATPLLVSVVSFTVYVLLNHKLDAATAFTAISLFNILRFPMQLLPMTINNVYEARVSLKRIQDFMDLPELNGLPRISESIKNVDRSFIPQQRRKSRSTLVRRAEIPPLLPLGHPAASIEGVSFFWPNGTPLLKDVTLQCCSGELVAIVGPTGCGKSGILLSLLGCTIGMPSSRKTKHRCNDAPVQVLGRIAYASQQPWIQNATVRDNICFGQEYEIDWYKTVLRVCALVPDLAVLPAGDLTEIGERGINLSGGQKQRVALARAVYQRADVYLLDDCLSAVDANVAATIFDACINGILRNKAVLLVTHKLSVLPFCSRIVLLKKGQIVFDGPYKEAQAQPEFQSFALIAGENGDEMKGEELPDVHGTTLQILRRNSIPHPKPDRLVDFKESPMSSSAEGTDEDSEADDESANGCIGTETATNRSTGVLIDEEFVHSGDIKSHVYTDYLRGAGGWMTLLGILICLLGGSCLLASGNFWLSYWADHSEVVTPSMGLSVYCGLGILYIFIIYVGFYRISRAAQRAAWYFHQKLLRGVLDAPMSFFDTTPTGRILNRFSRGIYTVDESLPNTLTMYLNICLSVFMTLTVIVIVFPLFIVFIFPIMILYKCVQDYYIPTSRQLQRLESASRSPIFAHFSETVDGTETIRAFRQERRFIKINEERLDRNNRAYYMGVSANRWLAIRLELAGTITVSATVFLSVLLHSYISPGLCGLAISYALNVTQALNWLVRTSGEKETSVVSVERINDYAEGVKPEKLEPDTIVDSVVLRTMDQIGSSSNTQGEERLLIGTSWRDRLTPGWPAQGHIVIQNLDVRYREGTPLVLKNLSIEIAPGEKIGLVGRTGAGKSSMLLALLRLVEPAGGRIIIDGVDTQDAGLRYLRSKFSIIPQDPVLFAGTVRFNVDALGEHSDEEIWEALERAHLKEHILSAATHEALRQQGSDGSSGDSEEDGAQRFLGTSIGGDGVVTPLDALSLAVQEGGRNFSMGQRQLLCLARALLRRSRILLLDEATSVVDPKTDKLIQETIRRDFHDSTVVTIAHRLDTIMDYNRVLVLADGALREFDSPEVLFSTPGSLFRAFCQQANVKPQRL